MPTLRSCPACAGFVPAASAACPHCDVAVPTKSRKLAKVIASLLAGGACSMTLMACYGAMPYRSEGPEYQSCNGYAATDTDADGYCAPQDCNDNDRTAFPGAEDPDLDNVDQNCDGVDGWRDPNAVAAPTPAETVVDAGAAPTSDPLVPITP